MVDGYDAIFDCCVCQKPYHEYCWNKDMLNRDRQDKWCYAPKESGLFFKASESRWNKAVEAGVSRLSVSIEELNYLDVALDKLELELCCVNCYDKLSLEHDVKL